jgi:hypothetical protein
MDPNETLPVENQEQASSSRLSYYRETTNSYGQTIYVPVVDVRDGMAERALTEQILKASNQSRYMSYNRYHVSKKNQNIL